MIFPTKENPGTREAHIASYEADWKDVLPKSETHKNELMADIVDGIRERWNDELEYANKTQTFPIKIYLPNRRVCEISESEFKHLKSNLIPTADKTGFVVISRGLWPFLKPILRYFLSDDWFQPTQIGGKKVDLSASVEYIRDPRDYKKIYSATKGVFYNELGFESIQESGLCSDTNYWMTKTQAQYIVNILPTIKDLDARAHPISTTSHGGYASTSHGVCSSGTCACTGGGCSASCCGH